MKRYIKSSKRFIIKDRVSGHTRLWYVFDTLYKREVANTNSSYKSDVEEICDRMNRENASKWYDVYNTCPNCGSDLEDGYCKDCGVNLNSKR